MKNFKFLISFLLTTILMVSCEEDASIGDIVAPSNIQVTAEIIGVDADHPFGDGSGVVNFSATADNVITYRFVSPGNQQMAPSGNASVFFTAAVSGVYTYKVVVVAIGTGGITSSATIDVEVFCRLRTTTRAS